MILCSNSDYSRVGALELWTVKALDGLLDCIARFLCSIGCCDLQAQLREATGTEIDAVPCLECVELGE
jgi:hypothetical protein